MSSYQYHFPPLTIFKDKNEDKEIVGLNYEYLDEICSFIESFLTEKDLTYKLIGVEYGYNLTELKFLDKSSYEYREEVIEKAGYHATTALYKALEEQLNKHFCTKSQIKINSVATTRGDESSFIVHLPHKYIREVAFRQILQKCKDEKYFTGCFSIRQNGTPYVLTGKQSQFITLSAENDSCIKNTIHCMISGLISLLSPADLSLILLAKDNSYDVYNKIPHLTFGEVLKDFKLFSAIVEYLENQIQLREKLFLEKQVEDIYEYNAIAQENKIDKIYFFIDDFDEIYKNYEIEWKEICQNLNKMAKVGDKYGINFFVVAPINNKFVLSRLKYASITKIAYKISSPLISYSALDDIKAAWLSGDNEAYVNAKWFTKVFSRVTTAILTSEEVQELCDFIKQNNLSSDKTQLLEQIKARSDNLNSKNQLTEEEKLFLLAKELIKKNLHLTTFTLISAINVLRKDTVEAKKVLDYCIEKGYIVLCDKFNYKVNLTEQEFEKIFNKQG